MARLLVVVIGYAIATSLIEEAFDLRGDKEYLERLRNRLNK